MSYYNDGVDDDDHDPDVDYDSLEQSTYDDSPGMVFYTCPRCGNEYLASFIVDHHGRAMCIDCWNELS